MSQKVESMAHEELRSNPSAFRSNSDGTDCVPLCKRGIEGDLFRCRSSRTENLPLPLFFKEGIGVGKREHALSIVDGRGRGDFARSGVRINVANF